MTVEDEANEVYVNRKTQVNPLKVIPKGTLIILLVIGIAVFYAAFIVETDHVDPDTGEVTQSGWIEKKTGEWILGIIIIIFIILIMREKDQGLITWRQAREIVRKEILYMQKYEDILPPGDVNISEKAFLWIIQGQRQKWYVGFSIDGPEGPTTYRATVDPYDGMLEGFTEMPTGWSGRDRPDVQWILPQELKWKERYGDMWEDRKKNEPANPEQPQQKRKWYAFGR